MTGRDELKSVEEATEKAKRRGDVPQDGNGPSGPFALPLNEFINAKTEAPPALIGDDENGILLPTGGLLIPFAKGGRGKTTLMVVDLAFHLASGVDWLGFTVPSPLNVLVIENEGPRELFRRKLEAKRAAWEHDMPGSIHVYMEDWGSFLLHPTLTVPRLRRYVAEHRIGLVMGDPLDSLGLKGVGSPEDTREFCKLLVPVGLTRDIAFLLPHHPRKAEAEDELDEISGAWGGRVDTLLKLDRLDGNRARLSFPKVRWSRLGKLPARILAFDPEAESYTFDHEEEPEAEERDHLAELIELMSDGTWRTPKEAAAPKTSEPAGIGASIATVRDVFENHEDLFEHRTGEGAQALGRSPRANLYRLTSLPSSVSSVRGFDGPVDDDKRGTELLNSPIESSVSSAVVDVGAVGDADQLHRLPSSVVSVGDPEVGKRNAGGTCHKATDAEIEQAWREAEEERR